jgi:hypothetical protein
MIDPKLLTSENMLQSIKAAGYVTFESETPYDLNIWGVRAANPVSNTFNDWLGCTYRGPDLAWRTDYWPATTDPGRYWLENPGRVEGTAILVPGQYRGAYALDLHAGSYEALCQRNGPVKVWRDDNKDAILDWGGPEYSGYYGINLHRSQKIGTTETVGRWSAGCQVFQRCSDFYALLSLAHKQREYHPSWSRYTYTLLTADQIRG